MININLVRFIYNENIVPKRLSQPFFLNLKINKLVEKESEGGREDRLLTIRGNGQYAKTESARSILARNSVLDTKHVNSL